MSSIVYDKIVVGGGVAGLASAYEIMEAARMVAKPFQTVVLTEIIHSPSQAGTNVVLGIDGFEQQPRPRYAAEICDRVRCGVERIREIVEKYKIDCRHNSYYQIIAQNASQNTRMAKLLRYSHGYERGAFRELVDPSQRVRLGGFKHSLETVSIGQINGVEFLEGLRQVIEDMGGRIIEGVRYINHKAIDDRFVINTSKGAYTTSTPPLLAGGPHLMSRMHGLPIPITSVYTAAAHVDLTPDHARSICARPTGFFSSTESELWGSLDEKNVLTFGHGISIKADDRQKLEEGLRTTFKKIVPYFWEAYINKLRFSFNAMACTSNQLPIVGRLCDYDVITGNCSRGFAQSFAEARAYAEWVVNKEEKSLRFFESLNISPDVVCPKA